MLTGFFQRMQQDPPAGVSASPVADNVMFWNAVIIGPSETPFEDGTFKLIMQFDEQYPNKPPTVKFVSRMVSRRVYLPPSLVCLFLHFLMGTLGKRNPKEAYEIWGVGLLRGSKGNTDIDSSILMSTRPETCVSISCRTGGRRPTTSPPFSHPCSHS